MTSQASTTAHAGVDGTQGQGPPPTMPASTATASTPPPEPAVVEGDPLSEHPALVKIRVLNRYPCAAICLAWCMRRSLGDRHPLPRMAS